MAKPPGGGIKEHYAEIVRCNRCGFCQAACPIFRSTGHEAGVARGRLALLRALVEGKIEWSKDLKEPLFACLLCGACTEHCFPALPTADLVTAARADYLDKVGRNQLHRLLFRHLLPHPGRLRLAAKAAALGKKSRLSKVAKTLGLLRIFGRDFPKAEAIVEHFPSQALRDTMPPGELEGRGEALRIGYFVGCGVDIMAPDAGQASLQVLQDIGTSVTVLENCCCGLPAETYGDHQAARQLAAKNLDLVADQDFDVIVTDCSSCAAFLKKYPALFDESDPRRDTAQAVASRVRDWVEVAAEADPAPVAPGGKLVVTYHDPCHASRGQGLVDEPRDILRALPNVEFRDMPEADWCCGGAGSYALSHYELSRQVLDRKMENAASTGADLLVTSCPACIVHLAYGLRLRGLPMRVCHLSELIGSRTPAEHP